MAGLAVEQVDRDQARRAQQHPPSCACTPDRLCLVHYGQLDPGRRAQARRQAGVHNPDHDRR